MNVDAEIRRINRRINTQIEQSAREALDRMDAKWPSLTQPAIETPANPAEAYGQFLRALNDGFIALTAGIARGWTAVDRIIEPTCAACGRPVSRCPDGGRLLR